MTANERNHTQMCKLNWTRVIHHPSKHIWHTSTIQRDTGEVVHLYAFEDETENLVLTGFDYEHCVYRFEDYCTQLALQDLDQPDSTDLMIEQSEKDQQKADFNELLEEVSKNKLMIAGMAAQIAAGFACKQLSPETVAECSVEIARAILNQVDS